MMRFVTCLLLLTFVANPATLGQGQSQDIEELFAQLKHPSNIAVELARREPNLHEEPEDVNKPFEPGEKLYFRILLTNTSMHPIVVLVSNPYFQNRPKLLKEGQEIPYRNEKLDNLSEQIDQSGGTDSVRLDPSVSSYVGHLNLSDWYAPLKAGRYELINRYRFVPKGDWLESPPITFEVSREKRRQ